MPHLLFSFGTLQDPVVQQAVFGRHLTGEPDRVVGFRLSRVRITDPAVIAASGSDIHPGLVSTGDPADGVDGVVFEVSDADLAAADLYEAGGYDRAEAVLASGRTAFLYLPR